MAPNWFELIRDDENRPDTKIWKDWMWEVSTWRYKVPNHNKKLSAYRLLHRLQGRYIPRLFGVVRLRITPESTTLHPITGIVQGLASISLASAWRNSSLVENCVLHNDIHTGNVVLRDGSRSPVTIDFGQADIREPELSDEEWSSVVWGSPDTHCIRNLLVNPEDGPWKRTVTPYEMSDPHYRNPLVFNEYVESMPEDFRRVTFESVLDTDWEGAREKVHQWRIRPGVRCRPIGHDSII
ncbi:hypothetical protein EV421DRAFT_1953894 [Armillaria borealis]|uniref:Uncharacterized protein n=1 Tax=Armillaria borealis TaxID=47425 RepID=A0AA39IDZ4_9AGAR|nr:hypothetical protein EV421DRAFT_1953894 [Armillaria borealis]